MIRLLLLALIVPLALVAPLAAGIGVGDAVLPSRTLEQERDALRKARADAEAAKQRGAVFERRALAATESAEKARRQAQAVAARVQQAEAEIAAAEARVAIVDTLQRGQRARLAERQQPIARLTAALQHFARRPTELALVQPGSVDDIVHVRAVMATIVPEIRSRTRDLRAELDRARELRGQADDAAQLLRASRDSLEEQRQALAAVEALRRAESRRLASSAGLERDRAIALGEDARDIGELMDRIREAGSLREQLAALDGPLLRPARPGEARTTPAERSQRAGGDAQPAYRLPVVGEVITGLGEVGEGGARSRGITLATRPDALVVAPANGRVAFAGPYGGFGQIVIIEHEAGWTTLIAELGTIDVAVGDSLAQGTPVGKARRDDPRVTVELRRNGRPIDILALAG